MLERKLRIESMIRELVASFVATEANPNPLITITNISTSSDCRNATVYFTTIPTEKEQDALIFLQRAGSHIRQHVKKKSNLKIIPNFKFEVDEGERARQRIDEIAGKI